MECSDFSNLGKRNVWVNPRKQNLFVFKK